MRILEVCASSVASAEAAAKGGAQRIELCTRLDLDGLTPTEQEIRAARGIECLTLNVLIRPREGDFVYSPEEVCLMRQQIEMCKRLGADGVVIGALTEEGDIDVRTTRTLIEAAGQMSITFHRAFDRCRSPQKALEQIIALGCQRLLTSGQAPTALEGIDLLARLHTQAEGRIIIMPGAGVNAGNAARILRETGCTEIHSSARQRGESVTSAVVVSAIMDAISQ